MKKISEMYCISGGTDYRHTCSECINCRKEKSQHACRLYREAGGKGPWKPYFIACKFYNMLHLPEHLRAAQGQQDTMPDETGIQMSIEDFPGVIP